MSDSTQSLGSLVECSLCLEPFTDPRMLTPCFHTFCYTCLDNHLKHNDQNGQFQCPVCRKQLPIPENGADDFQKNFFANKCLDIVDGTKAKAGRATHDKQFGLEDLCSNSEEGDPCNRPESFCLKCCESYCSHCSKAHARSKATRGHAQVSMEELTEEMFLEAKSQSEIPRCPKHEKKLKLFCKTCQDAVCSVCSHTSHQSHSLQELTELDKDLQKELNDVITSVQSLIETNEEARVETNQSQQQIEHTLSGVKEAMTKISEAVQQLLDSKTREINEKLTKMNADNKIQIEIQDTNLSLKQTLLKSFQDSVNDLLKKGTVYNRLAKLPEVGSRLKELQSFDQAGNARIKELPNSFGLLSEEFDGREHQIILDESGSTRQTFLFKFILIPKPHLPVRAGSIAEEHQDDGKEEDSEATRPSKAEEHQDDSEATRPPQLNKPEVCLATYGPGFTHEAAQMIRKEPPLDGKVVDVEKLEPLLEDRPQVDVVCCGDREIHLARLPPVAGDVVQDDLDKDGRKKLVSEAGPQVVESTQVVKPKVRLVTYGGGSTDSAAQMVWNDLHIDAKVVFSKPLEPMLTDRPQVDVICCSDEAIHSVVDDFEIDENIAEKRNLVLLYKTRGGSLEETRSALGQQAGLFKCIIWSSIWDYETSTAADTRLADYLRQVVGKEARVPPVAGNVVQHDEDKRKERTSEAGRQVETTQVIKPKVLLVTYGSRATDSAAQMVLNDLHINGKVVFGTSQKRLEPLPTDRPQVDVICCSDEAIHSVVDDFEIDENIAEKRNLVLLYKTRGGSLEETRSALGQQAGLFKCIIWSSIWDYETSTAADTRLADYLRQVVGKEARVPPVAGNVVQHDEDKRKERTSEAGRQVETTQVIKPKVLLVTYGSWSTADSAAKMVLNDLHINGKVVFSKPLEPMPTDRPQVDVISCSDEKIHSVVDDFEIDENIAEKRNLVLLYQTRGGSLEETRSALGQQAGLFKCIIWSSLWDYDTSTAATTRLADYLRQVVGKKVDAPPVAGDVLQDDQDSRKEQASEAGRQVEPTQVIAPTKPKVCMVTYGIGGTDAAAQTVMNELQLDRKTIFFKEQLQPLSTDGPQVDVICCIDQKILTVVADFELDEKIAEERNLVLFHRKHGGNLEDTRITLGQQSGLFKCIIWSSPWDLSSCYAATEKLADYLRQVAS